MYMYVHSCVQSLFPWKGRRKQDTPGRKFQASSSLQKGSKVQWGPQSKRWPILTPVLRSGTTGVAMVLEGLSDGLGPALEQQARAFGAPSQTPHLILPLSASDLGQPSGAWSNHKGLSHF